MKNIINLKRILILVAFATLLFASSVYATDINTMSNLQSVFTTATINENKITLDKNYDLENNAVIIRSGTYEIDLNGYNISSNKDSAIEVWNGNLKISNSSSSLGQISANKEDFASPVYIKGGTLTINNGKLGNPESASDCGLYMAGGTVIIENGEFAGLIHGLYIEDGILSINNGIIKSTTATEHNDAIGIYGGEVTINNGTFTSSTLCTNSCGLYVENYYEDISITINNGTFTGKMDGAEFYKETDKGFSITINGGIFIGDYLGLALYDDILSNIEISAGTFKSVATNSSERLGGIGIEYENTVPNINSIIKTNSSMYPSNTSIDSYIFKNNEYIFLRTSDEVIIDVPKTISIPNSIHGTITANKQTAIPGEEITLAIMPENGYKLKQISVIDKFGQMPVTITNNKFTMPKYNVIISAEFEEDINYVFIEGANGTIFNTSKNDLEFRINAEYSLLNKVYVDNNELSEDDFSSKSGSTIINLKNSYLKKLIAGKHTLKVSFTDGKEVITNFEIKTENKAEKDETPKTGTNNYIRIEILAITISVLGVLILRKKTV